jgi:hypothetical protein
MCEDMITAKLDKRWVSVNVPADCIRSGGSVKSFFAYQPILRNFRMTVFRWRACRLTVRNNLKLDYLWEKITLPKAKTLAHITSAPQ